MYEAIFLACFYALKWFAGRRYNKSYTYTYNKYINSNRQDIGIEKIVNKANPFL